MGYSGTNFPGYSGTGLILAFSARRILGFIDFVSLDSCLIDLFSLNVDILKIISISISGCMPTSKSKRSFKVQHSAVPRSVFHCIPAWGTVEHFEDTLLLDSLPKNV